MWKHPFAASILISFAILAGCQFTPAPPGNVSATQASSQPVDGRNLGPGLQPYAADPLFPYQEHNGGGGGRR